MDVVLPARPTPPPSNAFLIAAEWPWTVSHPREQPLQTPFVSLGEHQSLTCITTQFLLLVILWQLNQRNLLQSTQTIHQPIWLSRSSLVGSCFRLLRFFQNHILLSATFYTVRTLRRLNPVSSVLILLTMEEQTRHASLFQGLVPSWCQL